MLSVAVIVSTFNQPRHLYRCLLALSLQTFGAFDIVVADDGSDGRTRKIITESAAAGTQPITHVWQPNRGFRKTRILNKAVQATNADYLVFIDGDCVAHPDFLHHHIEAAQPGRYLGGSIIRLGSKLSDAVTEEVIRSGQAFRPQWLIRQGHTINRRFLRLGLDARKQHWLDDKTSTRPHWLGSNSSCFRLDLVAVNGFDHRFTYGFEDADFGNRLENYGVAGRNVRWSANLLHLHHDRPYVQDGMRERNLALVAPLGPGGRVRAVDGFDQAFEEPAQAA